MRVSEDAGVVALPPHRSARQVVGVAAIAVGAATAGAVLVAVPARLLMRLVALSAGHPGKFSWVGSVGIVAVFAMFTIPGALLAAGSHGRHRWTLLAAGAMLLCVPATGIAADELGGRGGFSLWAWLGVITAGGGVYLCIAALPVVVLRLVDRWQ